MVSTSEAVINALKRTGTGLPGIDVLVLFGSQAKASARAGSDIDLAIGLCDRDASTRRAVEVAFARTTGGRADVVFLDDAPPQLRFEIARSGVLLIERTAGAWARERARAMVDWWDWAPMARRLHARAVARLRAET